jgi:GR25 family glycosyltransferase involved in LPS biosynthesis
MDKRQFITLVCVVSLVFCFLYFQNIQDCKRKARIYPRGTASLNEFFSHVYVINLDRRTDRLASFDKSAKEVGLAYERIPATDYHDIEIPAWIHTRKYERMRFTDGAYALCQSTKKVLEDAIAKGYDSILILEDDAEFRPDAQELWKEMQTKLPSDWQVLYFSQIHYDGYSFVECVPWFGKKPDTSIVKLKRTFSCAAYALHKSMFSDYLEFLKNPNMPIDNWLYELYQRKVKTAYGSYPALAIQAAGFSDIEPDNGFVDRKIKSKDGSQT